MAATSPTDLMIDVLKSPTTDVQLRIKYAQILTTDPNAQNTLLELLRNGVDLTTRRLICEALADTQGSTVFNGQPEIPDVFIAPLIDNLLSESPSLSTAAMEALILCRPDLVLIHLSELVCNGENPIPHRLVGISALETLPGKAPVCVISSLLEDTNPNIQYQAHQFLADLFAPPADLNPEQLRVYYSSQLETLDDQAIMVKQIRHLQRSLQSLQQELGSRQNTLSYWQQMYLEAKTREFEQIIVPEKRIEFLETFLAQQKEVSIRLWALTQLQKWMRTAAIPVDPITKPLASLLIRFINDPNSSVRQQTAMALAQLGENAIETAPEVLMQLQREKSPPIQAALLDTLGIFHQVAAVPEALNLLPSSDPNVSAAAARVLGRVITSAAPTDTIDIPTIIQSLRTTWHIRNLPPLVKREIIGALGKIAATERFHQEATTCGDILKEALHDADPVARSLTIPALANLYGVRVMELLINGQNMLEDADLGVRFAVVETMQKYGTEAHLPLLRTRLAVDITNDDMVKEIRKAFGNILNALTIPQVYHWVALLQKAPASEQSLLDASILILIDKINQARASGLEVDPPCEALALTYQADLALKQNQPLAALTAYSRLAELNNIDEAITLAAQQGILQLALASPDDTRLTAAQAIISKLVASAAGPEVLRQIGDILSKLDLNKPDQLMLAGHIVAKLVIPIHKYPNELLQQQWQKRRYEVTLTLVDSQILLLTPDNGLENASAISLMAKLDARLQPYPAAQSLADRRQTLQRFRTLITTSLTSMTASASKAPLNANDAEAATPSTVAPAHQDAPGTSQTKSPDVPPKTP